jgi:hypothetical protein
MAPLAVHRACSWPLFQLAWWRHHHVTHTLWPFFL